jgi:hypothetical protein
MVASEFHSWVQRDSISHYAANRWILNSTVTSWWCTISILGTSFFTLEALNLSFFHWGRRWWTEFYSLPR